MADFVVQGLAGGLEGELEARQDTSACSWVARVGFITGSSELLRPHVQSWRPPLTPAQPPSAVGVKAACGRRHCGLVFSLRFLRAVMLGTPI